MKKTATIILQSFIAIIPVICMLIIWNTIPETVPVHFDINFEPNRYGSKEEMLGVFLLLAGASIFTSILVLNLNKVDPKKRFAADSSLAIKISWTIILFLMLLSCFILYKTVYYHPASHIDNSARYMLAIIALFLTILGNFMNNIKPNYFVGIRTPWTLENEENWRLTHRLGAKLWFFGGIFMLLMVLFTPMVYLSYVTGISIFILVVVPVAYSYYIYSKNRSAD